MQFSRWTGKPVVGLALTAMLSACGGGGAQSLSSFAQAVGVAPTPAPAATDTPTPAPTPTPTATPAQAWVNPHWVDFQNGNDNNDGRTKSTAWKHAPGDPNASGTVAAYTPAAGDEIVFVSGVRYFGSITAPFRGTANSPITFVGESNDHSAVIDGSSASAQAQPCASSSACAGISGWQSVSVVTFPEALPDNAQLYANGSILTPAQWPNPADLFYNEEVDDMYSGNGTDHNAGVAYLPASVTDSIKSSANLRVAVWVQSNKIVEAPVRSISSGKVTFDPTNISAYTDRPSKFTLRGDASMIDLTGEYAIMPDRKTVLVKSADPRAVVYASTGRGGFDLARADHVTIKNLGFEHMSDIEGRVRSGLAISVQSAPASNITIENNLFTDHVLVDGGGVITLWDTTNAKVEGNTIKRIAYGSGMRILRNNGSLVYGNTIERVGRTAIMLMSNVNTDVVRNSIRDILGVHGNGLSAYLGNQHVKFIANTVTEAKQPATYHGNNNDTPVQTDILFANNLFVATDDALGAIISWGKNADGVKIVNNVLLGGDKGALRTNVAETNLTVRRNVIAGIIISSDAPAAWTFQNNMFTSLGVGQAGYFHADAITASLTGSAQSGRTVGNLQKFCPYITEFLDYTLLGETYGRSIGANFTCN